MNWRRYSTPVLTAALTALFLLLAYLGVETALGLVQQGVWPMGYLR